jgi:hypothetical protein
MHTRPLGTLPPTSVVQSFAHAASRASATITHGHQRAGSCLPPHDHHQQHEQQEQEERDGRDDRGREHGAEQDAELEVNPDRECDAEQEAGRDCHDDCPGRKRARLPGGVAVKRLTARLPFAASSSAAGTIAGADSRRQTTAPPTTLMLSSLATILRIARPIPS